MEIKKLADVVTWADGIIRDAGYNEEKYKNDAASAYCHVKAYELWRIRDAALETMERHAVYTNALNKDIADKAAKIELLEKEIEGRKEGYMALKARMDTKYISIDEHNDVCKAYEKKVAELKKESEKWQDLAKMNRDTICNQYDVCEDFKKKIAELEEKVKHQRENLDGINKTLEIRTKENESLIKVRNNLNKEIEAHESENARLSEKIIGLKEEVKKRDKCIMEKNESINTGNEAIVNLRKQIGEHEEENKRLSDKIMKLHGTITELSHDIDNYKSWNASLHKDIKELKKNKEDDYGKSGFKRYIEHLIEEEERAVPERFKERLNEEITEIFTKEEETKKELNKKYGYAREIAFRIRSEVDKKRIVDIGEGAEKILGVSRELFDAAIKALVDDGYQEIIGRIPQATNSYVYMDMHVLATPDVETRETANAENIKSLDFDIPCGEDAIE